MVAEQRGYVKVLDIRFVALFDGDCQDHAATTQLLARRGIGLALYQNFSLLICGISRTCAQATIVHEI